MANEIAKSIFGEETDVVITDTFFTRFELMLLRRYNPKAYELAVNKMTHKFKETCDKFTLPHDVRQSILDGTCSLAGLGKLYVLNGLFEALNPVEFMSFVGAYGQWAAYNNQPEFLQLVLKAESQESKSPADILKRILESDN